MVLLVLESTALKESPIFEIFSGVVDSFRPGRSLRSPVMLVHIDSAPSRRIASLKLTIRAISSLDSTVAPVQSIDIRGKSDGSVVWQPMIHQVTYPQIMPIRRPLIASVTAAVLVGAYRFLGIAILSAILLGLVSYLALTLFYFFNQSWIEPRIISPTDTQVLQLSGQLSQASLLREQLVAQRMDLLVKLRDATRKATDSNQFQKDVKQTARQEVNDNLNKLASVQDVDRSYKAEAPRILESDKSFASGAMVEADKLYTAHLISEEEWLNRKTQLAQLGASALALQRGAAELDVEKNSLHREIDSYSSLVVGGPSKDGLNSDVLEAKRQLNTSELDEASAKDMVDALNQELSMTNDAIARQDRLLLNIHNIPYLKAVEQRLTIGFVPYSNAAKTASGTPIYGCSLGIIFCRRVGQVEEVLDGEVSDKHPFFNKDLRGLFVRVNFKDTTWDRTPVLFLGRAPLLF
jgi:hypothetical protein